MNTTTSRTNGGPAQPSTMKIPTTTDQGGRTHETEDDHRRRVARTRAQRGVYGHDGPHHVGKPISLVPAACSARNSPTNLATSRGNSASQQYGPPALNRPPRVARISAFPSAASVMVISAIDAKRSAAFMPRSLPLTWRGHWRATGPHRPRQRTAALDAASGLRRPLRSPLLCLGRRGALAANQLAQVGPINARTQLLNSRRSVYGFCHRRSTLCRNAPRLQPVLDVLSKNSTTDRLGKPRRTVVEGFHCLLDAAFLVHLDAPHAK